MEVIKMGNIYGFTGGNYSGNVYSVNGLLPTINTCGGGNKQPIIMTCQTNSNNIRCRKLTPKECGRAMGVSDEDINKMMKANSNTQLYKQFGNSIVVDVMVEMFKNLYFIRGDNERK